MSDFTLKIRLCDDNGIVSDERVEPGSPGTIIDPNLTYRKLLNNLRARNTNPDARKPYEGEPFVCTGSAHLAGHTIRCTSPAHSRLAMADALGTGLAYRATASMDDDELAVRRAVDELPEPHRRIIKMRAALAGYDAQYGHGGSTLAEQHPELPRGCIERIEAVVRALRDELAEVERAG